MLESGDTCGRVNPFDEVGLKRRCTSLYDLAMGNCYFPLIGFLSMWVNLVLLEVLP